MDITQRIGLAKRKITFQLSRATGRQRNFLEQQLARLTILEEGERPTQRKYAPYRALNEREKRLDFHKLNEKFNDLQGDLEDELAKVAQEQLPLYIDKVNNKLKSGDLNALSTLSLNVKGKVKSIVSDSISKSYESGKKLASQTVGVEAPATSMRQTQIKNLEAEDIAESFAFALNKSAKSTIKNGLAVDASVSAIVASVQDQLRSEADKLVANISSTLVGQNVNRGMNQVFQSNITKISKFQRSEVLDDRTCQMCEALDGRIVRSDDPVAYMDIVHSYCRGVWVPVFTDDVQPVLDPVPKSILDNFDTIDGRPVVNSFIQLKKPVKRK